MHAKEVNLSSEVKHSPMTNSDLTCSFDYQFTSISNIALQGRGTGKIYSLFVFVLFGIKDGICFRAPEKDFSSVLNSFLFFIA